MVDGVTAIKSDNSCWCVSSQMIQIQFILLRSMSANESDAANVSDWPSGCSVAKRGDGPGASGCENGNETWRGRSPPVGKFRFLEKFRFFRRENLESNVGGLALEKLRFSVFF